MSETSLILKALAQPTEILTQLQSGQLLRVEGQPGSALIICHRHYAELAGPGAAVGGVFDLDCSRVIPIGSPAIVYSETHLERIEAYRIRQRWMTLTQKAMASPVPLQRSHNILTVLHRFFGAEVCQQLPDEVIAQLVGVLPKTVQMVRPTHPASGLTRSPNPNQATVKTL